MNKAEAAKTISILQLNYPDSFRAMSDEDLGALVTLWAAILAEETYAEVQAAVLAHIATDTNRFMPPVGLIKQKVRDLKSGDEMSETEAWSLVFKAIRNSSYHSREEFEKLPPLIQRLVGSPSQLYEWAVTENLNLEVVSSNFMRSYTFRKKEEKNMAALPNSVKKVFDIGAERMRLTE